MKLPFSLPKRIRRWVASVTLQKRPPNTQNPADAWPKGIPADDLTQHCIEKLTSIGLAPLANRLRVLWNPRMRSTAGLAYPELAVILLNPKLQPFGPHEVERPAPRR
jgi:hypothetical protein